MTLTLPRAGNNPGRAARAGSVQVNENAGAFAQLGDVAFQVGTSLENDRLSREMQRLQVDLTKDMNDLRLQTEQIGTPDEAERAWQQGVESLRASYAGLDETGVARVDPKNAERFNLAFDDLSNRHAFSLGKRTLALRNAEREATFQQFTHVAAQTYAMGDEQMRSGILADLDAQIDADVAAGRIDAAEGHLRKQGFRAKGDNARAIQLVSDSPDQFLAAAEAGEFDGLPAERLARYRVQAQSSQKTNEATAQKEADRAARAREAEIKDRLRAVRDIAAKDASAVDEEFLDSPEVQAHPDYAQTRAALSLREEGKLIDQMSPRELQEQIQAELNQKKKHVWQTERLDLLRETLSRHSEGYARDPVAYAQDVGLDVPPMLGFDPAKPGQLALSLRVRNRWAQDQRLDGFTEDQAVLSDAERDQLKQAAGVKQDPAQRLALIKELADGLGDERAVIEAQALSGDVTFGWVASLVTRGVSDSTARDILDGQAELARKTIVAPNRTAAVQAFHDITDGEFRDQNELSDGVISAALALYAQENPAGDPSDLDETIFRRSVQRALGASNGPGGDMSVGGLHVMDTPGEFGGLTGGSDNYNLVLPVNVSRLHVQRGMNVITESLTPRWVGAIPNYQGDLPPEARTKPDLAPLTALSISGAAPDLGDPDSPDYDPAEIWEDMRLEAFWPDGVPRDQYLLYRMKNGRKQFLRDVEGSPFMVRLSDVQKVAR